MKLVLDREAAQQLDRLYRDMEAAYDLVAARLGHSCDGCPDNCCDSYFLHYTYIEWAYLHRGLAALAPEKQEEILKRVHAYELASAAAFHQGQRPRLMCPLNESGRCVLYRHRLMVCRTHGVPAVMTRPDGKVLQFPGCFRCQERIEHIGLDHKIVPMMERTKLLKRLVRLEQRFFGHMRHMAPKVKMTIARMLLSGEPTGAHGSDPNRDVVR